MARTPNAPTDAPPAAAALHSLADADAALGLLGRVRARLRTHAAIRDAAEARTRAEYVAATAPLQAAETVLAGQIQQFITTHPELFQDPKTRTLANGNIGLRLGRPAVEIADGQKETSVVKRLAERLGGSLVAMLEKVGFYGLPLFWLLRFKPELNRDGIHEAVRSERTSPAQLLRAGIVYRVATDAPFLDPFEVDDNPGEPLPAVDAPAVAPAFTSPAPEPVSCSRSDSPNSSASSPPPRRARTGRALSRS